MNPIELKEKLFEAFVGGVTHGQLNNLENSFDKWLVKDLDLYCECHEPVFPNPHTELCQCKRPNYFNVGDTENGCTCTGIIDRFLTTEELIQIVEAIPDEKIEMQNQKGNMNKETNKFDIEIKNSYWIMDHIIFFRGDTHVNCPETKWVKGSLERRIVEFKNNNINNGHNLLRAIEKKEDPCYQQDTQKQRVIALFKDMLINGYN